MDALLSRVRTDELHASAWMSPERGLWVATSDGCYHGMVERIGSVYRATDDRGAVVGEFTALGDAQVALHAARSISITDIQMRGDAAA